MTGSLTLVTQQSPLTVLAIVSSLKSLPDCLLFGKLTPFLRESKELVLLSLSDRCPTKHTFGVLKNLRNNTLLCIQGFIFFLYLQFICKLNWNIKFNDVWSFAYLMIFYKFIIYVGIWAIFTVAIEFYQMFYGVFEGKYWKLWK